MHDSFRQQNRADAKTIDENFRQAIMYTFWSPPGKSGHYSGKKTQPKPTVRKLLEQVHEHQPCLEALQLFYFRIEGEISTTAWHRCQSDWTHKKKCILRVSKTFYRHYDSRMVPCLASKTIVAHTNPHSWSMLLQILSWRPNKGRSCQHINVSNSTS